MGFACCPHVCMGCLRVRWFLLYLRRHLPVGVNSSINKCVWLATCLGWTLPLNQWAALQQENGRCISVYQCGITFSYDTKTHQDQLSLQVFSVQGAVASLGWLLRLPLEQSVDNVPLLQKNLYKSDLIRSDQQPRPQEEHQRYTETAPTASCSHDPDNNNKERMRLKSVSSN